MISAVCGVKNGCCIGPYRINIIAYADDIALLADSKENLEKLCHIFERKVGELNLRINNLKSKIMIFYGKKSQSHGISHKDQYEVVKKYKYLGHVLRDDFSDKNYVEFRLDNFYAKYNSVISKFPNVNHQALLFLFEAYCVSDYGLSLWDMKEILKSQFLEFLEF